MIQAVKLLKLLKITNYDRSDTNNMFACEEPRLINIVIYLKIRLWYSTLNTNRQPC